jgi:archaellum biogenesis ATPase FlaH
MNQKLVIFNILQSSNNISIDQNHRLIKLILNEKQKNDQKIILIDALSLMMMMKMKMIIMLKKMTIIRRMMLKMMIYKK